MNIYETIMTNIIFISFPLMFCLLCQTYHQTVNNKKNKLYLDVALFSAFYFILKFGLRPPLYGTILFLNVPLVIAYYKKRVIDCILLSFCIILYSYSLGIPILFLLCEYTLYYIIYRQSSNEKKRVIYLLTMKCFFYILIIFTIYYNLSSNIILQQLTLLIAFLIVAKFTIYLFDRVEEILSLHSKFKELEKEKQLRESLFKITHEIKNPIAVCKGYLDMFDVNQIEHSRKYIPILKEEIARVLILLEDFLSINKIKVKKEIMDINLLLEQIHHNFLPILEARGIDAEFTYQEDELFILGDYNRLSQVLINIVKNSIEAIPENSHGNIKVFIEMNNVDLKINVEDNGKGMSKEELSKIKEPFFTTKTKGTGLGIYLSNEIIKEHDGTIQYTSKEGKGTKVTLTFPKNISEFNF